MLLIMEPDGGPPENPWGKNHRISRRWLSHELIVLPEAFQNGRLSDSLPEVTPHAARLGEGRFAKIDAITLQEWSAGFGCKQPVLLRWRTSQRKGQHAIRFQELGAYVEFLHPKLLPDVAQIAFQGHELRRHACGSLACEVVGNTFPGAQRPHGLLQAVNTGALCQNNTFAKIG
jgi:hypothetical protein